MLTQIVPDIEPIFGVPYTLYRDDNGEDRYYYRFDENTRHSYISVTSFTSRFAKGEGFANWYGNVGTAHAKAYARYRADYGTQMHIEIVELVRAGRGSFEEIAKRQTEYCKANGYGWALDSWIPDILRDILAFLKFVKDNNVSFVFAELAVYSDEYGVAGSIDFGIQLDFNRGRVNALLDLKSGRKGFYEGHALQLQVYKKLWNDLFKEHFEVTHVFNWAPKAWRQSSRKEMSEWPTYSLKNQTNARNNVEARLSLVKSEGWISPPDSHMEIRGNFSLENFDISQHIKTYGIIETAED